MISWLKGRMAVSLADSAIREGSVCNIQQVADAVRQAPLQRLATGKTKGFTRIQTTLNAVDKQVKS